MRKLLLATTFLVASSSLTASALVGAPVPKPRPDIPIEQSTPPRNPDPFSVNTTPIAPVVIQPPAITVHAPASADFFNWIWVAIGGLFTSLFGFKIISDSSGKPDLAKTLADPAFRSHLDQAILNVIATGAPGSLLATIPGVGPFEPLIRKLVTAELSRHAAETTPVKNDVLETILNVIKNIPNLPKPQ